LNPHINKSGYEYVYEEKGIRCPLSIIKNVGRAGYSEIEKARVNGEFTSFVDFVSRCYSQILNRKALIYLIYAGCFDKFGYNKKTLINNLDSVILYAELVKDGGMFEIEEPHIIEEDDFTKSELIDLEFETYGFYFKLHPTSINKNNRDIDLINISNYVNKTVSVVLLVDRVKEIIDKNNKVMAFVNGSDNTDSISVTLFHDAYEKCNDISKKDIIRVVGKVENDKRYNKYQIIAKYIEKL